MQTVEVGWPDLGLTTEPGECTKLVCNPLIDRYLTY